MDTNKLWDESWCLHFKAMTKENWVKKTLIIFFEWSTLNCGKANVSVFLHRPITAGVWVGVKARC